MPPAASSPRNRLRGVIATAAAVLALTGCSSTSFDAQTNAVYDPGVGTNARGGGVDVLNALVVDNGDGTGTVSAMLVLNPGAFDPGVEVSPVTLEEFEALTLVGEDIRSTVAGGGITLEPNQPVQLGEEARITLSGDKFAAGDMVTLNFRFDRLAEPVELDAPVVERTPMYDGVATPEAEPASTPATPESTPTPTP